MVTSSYEWKIQEWDEKPQTNKHLLRRSVDLSCKPFPTTCLIRKYISNHTRIFNNWYPKMLWNNDALLCASFGTSLFQSHVSTPHILHRRCGIRDISTWEGSIMYKEWNLVWRVFHIPFPLKTNLTYHVKWRKFRKDRYNLKSCAFWDSVIFYFPVKGLIYMSYSNWARIYHEDKRYKWILVQCMLWDQDWPWTYIPKINRRPGVLWD